MAAIVPVLRLLAARQTGPQASEASPDLVFGGVVVALANNGMLYVAPAAGGAAELASLSTDYTYKQGDRIYLVRTASGRLLEVGGDRG